MHKYSLFFILTFFITLPNYAQEASIPPQQPETLPWYKPVLGATLLVGGVLVIHQIYKRYNTRKYKPLPGDSSSTPRVPYAKVQPLSDSEPLTFKWRSEWGTKIADAYIGEHKIGHASIYISNEPVDKGEEIISEYYSDGIIMEDGYKEKGYAKQLLAKLKENLDAKGIPYFKIQASAEEKALYEKLDLGFELISGPNSWGPKYYILKCTISDKPLTVNEITYVVAQ